MDCLIFTDLRNVLVCIFFKEIVLAKMSFFLSNELMGAVGSMQVCEGGGEIQSPHNRGL